MTPAQYLASIAGGGGGPTAAGLGLGLVSVPPILASETSTNLVNGTLLCQLTTAAAGAALSHMGIWLGTAGVTPGAGVNRLAIFTEAGAQVAQTVDMTAAFEGTGVVEGALQAAFTPTAGANYYLAALASFTGTVPAAQCFEMSPEVPALNGHLLSQGFTGQTTVPATITPAAGNLSFFIPLVYAR
jgi:hypothetical protein